MHMNQNNSEEIVMKTKRWMAAIFMSVCSCNRDYEPFRLRDKGAGVESYGGHRGKDGFR